MSPRALLILNGDPPPRKLARHLARLCPLVVAADGGADVARKVGLRPDLVIGDFDSISAATRKALPKAVFLRDADQETTDFEKALGWLRRARVPSVTVLGAAGDRLDHTLANLSVLWNYAPGMSIELRGDGWSAVPLRGRREFRARIGSVVSLIPFGPCSGVTLRGLRYPLTNARMPPGRVGVSNIVAASPFSVSVRKGRALVIVGTPAR
jgi:thiamine pyrophosphokinase